MTIQQAAQSALDVQYACNLGGVARSLDQVIREAVWPAVHAEGKGTHEVATHPIVTMYLLKMCELNGCGSTLVDSYEAAEKACQALAA